MGLNPCHAKYFMYQLDHSPPPPPICMLLIPFVSMNFQSVVREENSVDHDHMVSS